MGLPRPVPEEKETIMAQLIDALLRATKSTAVGFGFAKGTTAARSAKGAALLVTAKSAKEAGDLAKAGGDILIVTPDAARGFKADLPWGVDLRGQEQITNTTLRAWHDQGAGFILMGMKTPARAFASKIEHLDRALDIIPPTDDPLMLKFRALNLLEADVAIFEAQFTAQDLANLTVEQFAQLRAMREALRFPTIIRLREAPAEEDLPLLVKLGAQGIWLLNATADQIAHLREGLERVPREPDDAPLAMMPTSRNAAGGEA